MKSGLWNYKERGGTAAVRSASIAGYNELMEAFDMFVK